MVKRADHPEITSAVYCDNKSNKRERSGSVVEHQTPERVVGGSKPTSAMLCP